jgi:membrane-bound metal-dependent hydrolase YbcI (DUF457 family)
MFLLANVLVDVEVLFAAAPYPHRHWHWHTLLIGGLIGAAFGAALYLAGPLRNLLGRLVHLARLPYPDRRQPCHCEERSDEAISTLTTPCAPRPIPPRLLPMILGGMTGVWTHVLIDAFYHYDVQPFWPARTNPLNHFARQHGLTQDHIQTICLAFWLVAIILYAAAVWSFHRNRSRRAGTKNGS